MSTRLNDFTPGEHEPGGMSAGDRLKTVTVAAMSDTKKAGQDAGIQPTRGVADMATVERIVEGWPKMAQKSAREIIGKYGAPNEAIDSRLIWYENGPWKRTICYRDEIPHHFPNPHSDTLECVIDYQVPLEKVTEVLKFDGSITVERTSGEISSRCDMEAANFLALNMVHEIVTGNMTAEQARDFLTETAAAYAVSRSAPHAERLMFDVPTGQTSEKDHTTIAGAVVRQAAGKIKDAITG
jgi:hypothetical protein